MTAIPLPTLLNTTLKRKEEIKQYIDLCVQDGFVHRSDPAKNWDNYKALKYVLKQHPNKDAMILDAGGIQKSAFLPSLQLKGYRNLIALDFENPQPALLSNGIIYKRGDITATPYMDAYFDAVACLSVIEHGVDLEAFFSEMQRIIKVGGSLIVSTDYWESKIENVDGRRAYGVPVHIFSREEIVQAIQIARKHGFTLVPGHPLDFTCQEQTISWMGFNYTFIVLGFLRR